MPEQVAPRWDDPMMWEPEGVPTMEPCDPKFRKALLNWWLEPRPDVVRDASTEGEAAKPDEPKGEEEKPQP